VARSYVRRNTITRRIAAKLALLASRIDECASLKSRFKKVSLTQSPKQLRIGVIGLYV
jgi:hypothetical protein